MTEVFAGAPGRASPSLLLEREGDLAQLGAAMSRARSGAGRIVLIEGAAGMGKTRLLDEACERARDVGLEVLAARGGELERGYAFGVVRQLLESIVARATPAEREELLAGAAVLAEPVFAVSATAPSGAGDPSQSILHGLYWLVANLSERAPLLLAVDDLQWVDEPSARFLLYLAHRLQGLPVVVALALRTGEPGGEADVLRALRLEAQQPVVAPSALSPQATLTLAAAHLARDVPEEVGRACHAATRGNPFLLTELLQILRANPADSDPAVIARTASDRIASAILLRMARAGAVAVALARAVAVLGDSADAGAVAAIAQLDPAEIATVADALGRAEILAPDSNPLRFVHALVRTAVYDDMPRAERARLHARAAELLGRGPGGADTAALHLLLTEPAGDERTVALLREAAGSAAARGAPQNAAELLRRALREPPSDAVRPALLLELGAAAARAGHADAIELLREAFGLAAGDAPARARAGLELAFALGVSSGRLDEALTVLEGAREGLDDEELRTLLDARLVMYAVCVPALRGRLRRQLLAAQGASSRSNAASMPALRAALVCEALFCGTSAAQVAELAESSLAGGELMQRDIEMDTDFALSAVGALMYAGRLHEARHHADDGIAHARARGSPFAVARLASYRALVHWRLGELVAAEADAHVAVSVDAAWGIPHAISAAVLAQVRIERGDLRGARAALADLDADRALLEVTPNQVVREAQARLLVAEGRPRAALSPLTDYARWEHDAGVEAVPVPLGWRPDAALAHLQLGEIDEARALAAEGVAVARSFGAGPQLGIALRALALAGAGERARGLLEEAVAVLEASGARVDQARAMVDLGRLLRQGGRRTAAADVLRAARELAHRCSATALVESAAEELRLAGARPRRIAVSGRASLTPGEHRVGDLAAQGLSNKEIAQALFVTLRTVEMHLSNAYRKLAISSRDELPAALSDDA